MAQLMECYCESCVRERERQKAIRVMNKVFVMVGVLIILYGILA